MKENNTQYIPLVLPNREKRVRQCAAIHAMAALFMFMYAMQYVTTLEENWIYVVAIAPFSLYILFTAFFRKRHFNDAAYNRSFRILEIGFGLMGAMHFIQKNQPFVATLYVVLVTLLALFLYIELRILQQQYIIVSDDKVIIEMSFRNKVVKRSDIDAIILKGNYLTLKYKNEQIGQYEVQDGYSAIT